MTLTRITDEGFRLADQPHHRDVQLPPEVKLGLLNLGSHKPRLKLADYIADGVAPPPPAVSRPHPGFGWGMLANDRLSDCVCAAILHAIQSFHLDAGTAPPGFQDADAIALYEKIGGYNPSNPSSDQGCDEATAMQDWENGLPQTSDGQSHAIAGTVAIDSHNLQETRIGVNEFGGVYDGVGLPRSAQGQTTWDVIGDPDKDPDSQSYSWGGHAVFTREYDPQTFSLLTWGNEILETVAFRTQYHDQAFVVVTKEQLNNSQVGPTGVQWPDLLSDLNKLPPIG